MATSKSTLKDIAANKKKLLLVSSLYERIAALEMRVSAIEKKAGIKAPVPVPPPKAPEPVKPEKPAEPEKPKAEKAPKAEKPAPATTPAEPF